MKHVPLIATLLITAVNVYLFHQNSVWRQRLNSNTRTVTITDLAAYDRGFFDGVHAILKNVPLGTNQVELRPILDEMNP